MTRPRHEADDDARRAYDLAVKCWREACIRDGSILPEKGNKNEERWRVEGPRPPSRLDTARDGR